jgi:ATP phosphoribosyltransferase
VKKIKIALQKSGRLAEESLNLIRECGIQFSNGAGKLKSESSNFPMEFLFLRDDDIPGYVADGVADIGIVGENVLIEKNKNTHIRERLGFSRCRLSIAIPKNVDYTGLEDLQGLNIATSYPKLLSGYLESNDVSVCIHEISGSVEIAPSIGLAEAICDIVSSGSTLISNGLKEVETVFNSEAVLISGYSLDNEAEELLQKFIFRIKAVRAAKNNKYILLNAPDNAIPRILQILPGMKSPTVIPLAIQGWSSLHSVINENEFWEIIENLKEAGAEGILVVPIEKMIY